VDTQVGSVRLLVRQGEGPAAAYQRYHDEQRELEAKVERICNEICEVETGRGLKRSGVRSAPGDRKRLRGIPVQTRGVSGLHVVTDEGARLGFEDVDGSWCSAQEMLCA
jgi:hypothetical protein